MKREEKGEEEEEGKGVKERKKLVRVSETRRGRGSWWWLLIVVIDSSIGWNRKRIAREEGNLEPRVIFLIFWGKLVSRHGWWTRIWRERFVNLGSNRKSGRRIDR